MSGIMVKGIRIDNITIARKEGVATFTAGFSLLTPNGTVLATQLVNEYPAHVKLEVSAALAKAIRAMSDVLKDEIETVIGLKEGDES